MTDFVDRWAAFWSAPSADSVAELADDNIVLRYPGIAEPLRGIDAWRSRVQLIVDRLPDVRLEVTHQATVGDLCFVSWQAFATVNSVPVTWEGTDRMTLANGLVVDSMVAFDPAGFRAVA